ncbi:hypothetical protein LY76DRAFT_194966 [Colletotrichum caudatum]|nr:hypothetical protein LY76DRAFT_194966 [Colletotrichum caudatum]
MRADGGLDARRGRAALLSVCLTFGGVSPHRRQKSTPWSWESRTAWRRIGIMPPARFLSLPVFAHPWTWRLHSREGFDDESDRRRRRRRRGDLSPNLLALSDPFIHTFLLFMFFCSNGSNNHETSGGTRAHRVAVAHPPLVRARVTDGRETLFLTWSRSRLFCALDLCRI